MWRANSVSTDNQLFQPVASANTETGASDGQHLTRTGLALGTVAYSCGSYSPCGFIYSIPTGQFIAKVQYQGQQTSLYGINNNGQAIVRVTTNGNFSFVYDENTNTYTALPFCSGVCAFGINDQGQIVGNGSGGRASSRRRSRPLRCRCSAGNHARSALGNLRRAQGQFASWHSTFRDNVGECFSVQWCRGIPWMYGIIRVFAMAYCSVYHDVVAMVHRSRVIQHVLVNTEARKGAWRPVSRNHPGSKSDSNTPLRLTTATQTRWPPPDVGFQHDQVQRQMGRSLRDARSKGNMTLDDFRQSPSPQPNGLLPHPGPRRAVVGCQGRLEMGARIRSAGRGVEGSWVHAQPPIVIRMRNCGINP